jgi:hypothetical protein
VRARVQETRWQDDMSMSFLLKVKAWAALKHFDAFRIA